MSADAAAAKLIEMIHSKKVDDRTKLMAVKDLLDRANLSGKQTIEVGVVQPRSFLDFVGEAIIDVDVEEGDEYKETPPARYEDIYDADLVEDEPLQTRHDRAAFMEIEQQKRSRPKPVNQASPAERQRRDLEEHEKKVFADLEERDRASTASKRREAFMRAIDAGATHDQAHAAGERAVSGGSPSDRPRRRARQSTAQIIT